MARTKENKAVAKKKVNKYTEADCRTALAKLSGQKGSKHYQLIEARLNSLTA